MKYVVETKDLTKIYRSRGGDVKALDNANIKIPQGSIFGVFGPNGAGKTTMMSILVGMLLPTSGGGKVLGHDVLRESVEIRRRTGLMPEGFGFYEDLSAMDNLVYLGQLDGLSLEAARERASELLEAVGLSQRADAKVGTFSRGMKQRLCLAQALLKNPDLLIMDEPTAGLDPQGADEFRDLMKRITKEGRTVLISTHLLHEIGMICTHAALIKEGSILAQGSLEKLSESIKKTMGYSYEIQVEIGSEDLVKELNALPSIKRIVMDGNNLTVTAEADVSQEIYETLRQGGYDIGSFTPLHLTWDDIYKYYQEERS